MSPVAIPTAENIDLATKRVQRYAKKNFIGRNGVKDIRVHFKTNAMTLEVVKEAKEGLVGRIFKMGSVRGVGKLARLEYLGPDKWKFFKYNYDATRYETHRDLRQGTVEECMAAVGKLYFGK